VFAATVPPLGDTGCVGVVQFVPTGVPVGIGVGLVTGVALALGVALGVTTGVALEIGVLLGAAVGPPPFRIGATGVPEVPLQAASAAVAPHKAKIAPRLRRPLGSVLTATSPSNPTPSGLNDPRMKMWMPASYRSPDSRPFIACLGNLTLRTRKSRRHSCDA